MRPWIVIPVFEEAPTIGRVVRGARLLAPVLVVDDGSPDGSAEAARLAGAEVIAHGVRRGKGAALRTGFAAARRRGATHVVTLDGDGQHDPEDARALLAAARRAPRAIVVGSRLAADPGGAGLLGSRLNAIRVAGFFVNWASDVSVQDTQSGFRVYPLALFDEIGPCRGGFVFETEVLVAAGASGWPVFEVPVRVIPRAGRRSRFRPIADGVAVGAYLAGRTLARWAAEAGAAGREIAAVLSAERRRARHTEMLAAGAPHAANPATWGAAVSAVVARHAERRLGAWWRHPRRRRAAVAARASLATPVLLALALAQAAAARWMPDLVTPLVERLYSQARLDAALAGEALRARDAPVVGGLDP